jgi:hypothetical protein
MDHKLMLRIRTCWDITEKAQGIKKVRRNRERVAILMSQNSKDVHQASFGVSRKSERNSDEGRWWPNVTIYLRT